MAPPAGAVVPRHVPPSVQRPLDRLADVPVAVFDATWTLLSWNRLWAAVLGEPPAARGRRRNLVWQLFAGSDGGRIVRTDTELEVFRADAVAELRAAAGHYPGDAELRELVEDLRRVSAGFGRMWDAHAVGHRLSDRKTIAHPEVALLTVDCDVLTVTGADLRIVVYTAAPGSSDADALALLSVVGTQAVSR